MVLLFSIYACLNALATYAQENDTSNYLFEYSFEELWNLEVSSVSFFELKTNKSPGYVYQYNMDKSANSSHLTYEDIINNHVPGNVSGEHNFMGNLHGTRGLLVDNNSKTVFMLDGQSFNQKVFYGSPNILKTPLTGDIAKLDVINGPASIVHGSGAINGIINFIPKNGTDYSGLEINTTYGTAQKMAKFEMGYGKQFGHKKDIYFYAGIADAQGFKPDIGQYVFDSALYKSISGSLYNQVVNQPVQGYGKPVMRLATYVNLDNFELDVFYNQLFTHTNTLVHSGYFGQRMLAVNPSYKAEINENESIELRLSSTFFDNEFNRLETQNEVVNNGETFIGGGREMQFEAKLVAKTLRINRNQIAVGGVFGMRDFMGKKQFFTDDLPFVFHTPNTGWNELSLFVEDIYSVNNQLSLSFGLRYDQYYLNEQIEGNNYEGQNHVSPRIALAYEVNSTTNVKLSYQEGFRHPDAGVYRINNIRLQGLVQAGYEPPSLTLKPEFIQTFELNVRKGFYNQQLQFGANLFYNNYKQTLIYTEATPNDRYYGLSESAIAAAKDTLGFPFGNILNIDDDFTTYGTEIMVDAKPYKGLLIESSYSYAVNTRDSINPILFPRHLFKFNANQHFFDNTSASVSFIYTPKFNDNIVLNDTQQASAYFNDDRWLLSGSVSYEIINNLWLTFKVQNILAENQPPVVYFMEPTKGALGYNERFYYLSLKYTLPNL